MTKLEQLADIEGHAHFVDMLDEIQDESIVPAICTNEGCDNTDHLEPDCRMGYCDVCKTNTMQSCMVLAGII